MTSHPPRILNGPLGIFFFFLNFASRLAQGYGQGEGSYLAGNLPDLSFYVTLSRLIAVRYKCYARVKDYVKVAY